MLRSPSPDLRSKSTSPQRGEVMKRGFLLLTSPRWGEVAANGRG